MFHHTQQGSIAPYRFEDLQTLKTRVLEQNIGGQRAQAGRLIFAT